MFTALLPMKGHSERVPSKNIRHLGGKPLFFHIARTLLSVTDIERLVINTDSQEIADLAVKEYGDDVTISWRPVEIQGDMVSMNRIIEYDLGHYPLETHFIQTHSTNPFLKAKTIEAALCKYREQVASGAVDSLFSVTEIRARLYRSDLTPINHNPRELLRTQDLDPVYEENSNFYLFSGSSFMLNRTRIGAKPGIFAVNDIESLDIDTPDDWELASHLVTVIPDLEGRHAK